jgi:Transposase
MGISEATFYNWKKKYGGLGISELCELRMLKDENVRLKKMVADISLDKQMLQDVIEKALKSIQKKQLADYLSHQYRVSTRRICRILMIHHSVFLSALPKGRCSTKKPSSGDCNNTGKVWPLAYLHLAEA